MTDIKPGARKYEDGDSIPGDLGSDAPAAGDAVAQSSADGNLVQTTGDNGFAGVLGASTPDSAVTGDRVTLEAQGIVRAKVTAAVGSVAAGQQLAPGATGALTNVDDGTGSAEQAGPGDLQAWSSADANGYALVRIP